MNQAKIIDRGYRTYDGERRGVAGAIRSVAWYTTRSILGLGRPARHKIFPVLVFVIAFLPSVGFIAASILLGEVGGLLRADYWELFEPAVTPSLLFAAMVAPDALVRDRRDGMFALYLSTPLTRVTYLSAKLAAVLGCLTAIVVGPPLLLLIGYTVQSQGPPNLGEWLTVTARLLIAALVIAVLYAAIGLAAAAVANRRAFASVAAVAILAGGAAAGGALVEGADRSRALWLVSPVNAAVEVPYRLFGGESNELAGVNTGFVALAVAGWIALGSAVVAWRYRRIGAV